MSKEPVTEHEVKFLHVDKDKVRNALSAAGEACVVFDLRFGVDLPQWLKERQ